MDTLDVDIAVAGAGIGGISAAVAAARLGARIALIERAPAIGGTGVHSAVGLICWFRDQRKRAITLGLHREFFPEAYLPTDPEPPAGDTPWPPTYDETVLARRYREAIAACPTLTALAGAPVEAVERDGDRIIAARLGGDRPQRVTARWWIDATADGNLSALAGAEAMLGRDGDGAMQPATLTFSVEDVDYLAFDPPLPDGVASWEICKSVRRQLSTTFRELKAAGCIEMPRDGVLVFPYPDRRTLLFNQTRVLGVDPTRPETVTAARAEAERQIHQFMAAMRAHPALRRARIRHISPWLGVREGRRIVGDHVLTAEECLRPATFPDMVAACAYNLDIHDPHGSGTTLMPIPAPGYFHIPWRCLRAKGFANLLLGSRCISGTHEAHSGYRVMAPLSAIGQAAGTAAAVGVRRRVAEARAIDAAWIRWELRRAGQFVEGDCVAP